MNVGRTWRGLVLLLDDDVMQPAISWELAIDPDDDDDADDDDGGT